MHYTDHIRVYYAMLYYTGRATESVAVRAREGATERRCHASNAHSSGVRHLTRSSNNNTTINIKTTTINKYKQTTELHKYKRHLTRSSGLNKPVVVADGDNHLDANLFCRTEAKAVCRATPTDHWNI